MPATLQLEHETGIAIEFDHLRRGQHMEQVMAIENASFDEGTRLTEEALIEHMRKNDVIGMVALWNRIVVGFMLYELKGRRMRLLDMAVHPNYRSQKIGRRIIAKLLDKAAEQRRDHLEILLPEQCSDTRSFFEQWQHSQCLRIRPTNRKGIITVKLSLHAMERCHAPAAQRIETNFFSDYPGEPRIIAQALDNGMQGIVAHDEYSDEIVGFVLYERPEDGMLTMNGEYGLIVHPNYRRKGVGRAIMAHIRSLGKLVTLKDVNLLCGTQRAFLTAMGVTVPEIQRHATVLWG